MWYTCRAMKKIICVWLLAAGIAAAAKDAETAVKGVVGEDAKFALSLKQKPGGKARLVRFAEADDVARKCLPNGDEEFLFTYRDPAAPVRAARVTLRRDADGAVRHKLSCEMNQGWFLERTMFPMIEMPCEEAANLVLGSNKGGVSHDPSNWPVGLWLGCESPGSCCASFAAAWNDEAGRYFGIEDAKGYMKSFGFDRTKKGVRFMLQELVWTEGTYTQDYWVVTRRVAKGAEPLRWYDFADIYKEWDRQQTWSRTPFLARTDIPAWMKDAPAFTRFSRQWLGRPDAIRKFVDWWKRDIGDKPVVAALWGWEKVGTWWGPDYFPCHPSDEVFTATMKELRGRGFHPFAWPSGYNWSKVIGDKGDGTYEWDGREKFIKPVESHLVVNVDGSLCHVPAFWLRNGALTTLCGGDPWTHDWWNNLTKDLARRHCDIVQVDQVVGGKIRTCWSPKHGHPIGTGLWMWQTFRRQMEEMHAAIKSVEPDGLIGVEEPNMMYNDLVGIQDYRDLESSADEFAGVYAYLYHGYVPMFQSNPFRDEFFSLAFAAVEGQMPFYKPDFAELELSRPALQNGGFENLVDSVRGPAGWDRLIPNRMLQGVNAGKPLWNFSGCNNMGWLGYAATLEYGDNHGGDVSLRFDVPVKGGRDNGNPIQVSQTVNGLEPGRYMLSAWVKNLNNATAGRDALPRVRTGSLKYGTCDGEMGEIAFPSAGEWTKVSADVSIGTQLRLVIWAPPGTKFLIDDVRLERDGREVMVSGDSPYTKFMKKWIALYQGEGKDFLANGFQVKPPVLTCDTFRIAARKVRAVCFAAYESPSGARALVLANATDKPQRVTGEWDGRPLDIVLAPHDLQLIPAAVAASAPLPAVEQSPLVLFTAMTGRPGAREAEDIFANAEKAGYSQVMVYPRSGLELDYMGEEWLDFVGHCLKEAKRRGMKAWLYDEYNWPSGSCKGRVPMENPEWTYTEYAVRRNADGSFSWEIKRNDQLSMYDKYFDVNAYSVEAIRRFIELTHETYETRFASYMADGTIPGIFTDEPAHPSAMKWTGDKPIVTFRWWKELEEQYRERTGRDFRADVEESLRDPSKTGVWELYTELKSLQFRRAFFDPIRAWAKKVGIETCGHMISEGSPTGACNFNGLPLNTLCGLTLPGMDKIGSQVGKGDEWLTYLTAQYAIEHNSTPGRDVLDAHGGIELFALGPCDLTLSQMAQRIWLAALHGMDTYFLSLYHTTARGFLEKGGYSMYCSPTQPWFGHSADLHAAARTAAKWSRKRFVRDVAIRYPQRLFGRLALGRRAPGEKPPPLCALLNELSWSQISIELVQDDEKSDLKYVFSFKGATILEERSGRTFASAAEVREWLAAERKDAWRVVDASGAVVPGLVVRRYTDGTCAVLNLTDTSFYDLALVKGAEGREKFALHAGGVHLFAPEAAAWKPKKTLAEVKGAWSVACSGDTLRRIWFTTNGVARLSVKAPVKGARWVVCDYPAGSVKIAVNGVAVVVDRPAAAAPYAYAPIYRESAPFDLASGDYELTLSGRADDSVFLPVLWLAGNFAAKEPNEIVARPEKVGLPAPLAAIGLQDYAGDITYRAMVDVPSVERLFLGIDPGGLVVNVRLGGVDLGEKGIPPREWPIPDGLKGRKLPLEVTLTTSIRPVFGPDDVPGTKLGQRLWTKTQLNAARSGLRAAQWLVAP